MPARPDFTAARSQSVLGAKYIVRGIGLGPEVNGKRQRYEIAALRDDQVFVCHIGHNEGSTIVGRAPASVGRRGDRWYWMDGGLLTIEWHPF